MASIYRHYDGLGRGEFLSRASHPSGKIKKEKAENFSFHQNRKELGDVGDGWGDDGWRLRCSLHLWWSSGRGSPLAPAHRGALAWIWPRLSPVGAISSCPGVLAFLPGPCVFTDTHRCPRAYGPPRPPLPPPRPLSHCTHPKCPHQTPHEKGLPGGGWHLWWGFAFLSYLSFPPLKHYPG